MKIQAFLKTINYSKTDRIWANYDNSKHKIEHLEYLYHVYLLIRYSKLPRNYLGTITSRTGSKLSWQCNKLKFFLEREGRI